MKILRIFSLICLVILFSIRESNSKNFAYLVGTDGSISKLDTDGDTIVATRKLPQLSGYIQSGDKSVLASPNNRYLFIVVGRKESNVLVFDLKSLSLVKDLGLYTPEPDITIFLTPNAGKVFVVWWNINLQGGAWQFDIFDGVTLTKIKTLDFYFYSKQVTFSKDSSMLYAMEGGDKAKIEIISTTTMKPVSVIDLNTIWRSDVFAQDIEDHKYEKILISETEKNKLEDPSRDTLFVYNLITKESSPRISTGMSGDEKLSPDGTKIFVNEKQTIRSPDGSYVEYFKSLGRLHIYDVATGKKTGVAPFGVDKESHILGVHPNGNKVYIVGNVQGLKSLIVIDILNFKPIKTIRLSEKALFMIFYDD